MATSTIHGDTHFPDRLSSGSMGIPDGTVDNDAVNAAAAIAATKLQHQHALNYNQINTADTVTAGTFLLHVCRGIGQVIAVEVTSSVAPDADTDFFTINIVRRRAGAAVNVLTGVVTYNNTNALAGDGGDVNGNYGIITGTIDGANDDYVDDDVLEVVVAVTNNGGTNASGLNVTVVVREVP